MQVVRSPVLALVRKGSPKRNILWLKGFIEKVDFKCTVPPPMLIADGWLDAVKCHSDIVLSCVEVDSLILMLKQGVIQGHEITEPYAEAMVPIPTKGLIILIVIFNKLMASLVVKKNISSKCV